VEEYPMNNLVIKAVEHMAKEQGIKTLQLTTVDQIKSL